MKSELTTPIWLYTHQSLNGPVSILTRFSNHQLVSLTCFNVAKYSSNRHQSTYKIRHIVYCHLVNLLSLLITLRGRHLDKHPSMHLTCNHKIICINFKSISFLELFRRCQWNTTDIHMRVRVFWLKKTNRVESGKQNESKATKRREEKHNHNNHNNYKHSLTLCNNNNVNNEAIKMMTSSLYCAVSFLLLLPSFL